MTKIAKINEHIKATYDKHIDRQLSDLMLMDQFLNSSSCKNAIQILEETAKDTGIDKDPRIMRKFMKKLLPLVIPPGVKGCIRGYAFNQIIKKKLLKADLPNGELSFEPKDCCNLVHEIPDWCFRIGGKTIIGYNQLDIWKGGAQINRASKYIMDDALHRRLNKQGVWIVCVIARKISLVGEKNKVFKILQKGIATHRLLWPNAIINYLKKC